MPQCLQQYIVDKNYDHDTPEFSAQSVGSPPCGVIGEKFVKRINLVKRGDHCNLIVLSKTRKISGVK